MHNTGFSVLCAAIFQVRRAIGSPIAWTACGGRRVLRLRLRLRLPCDAAAFFGLAQMVMLQHDEGGGLTQTQGPGKPPLIRPGAVEPSPEPVARRDRGLGVGTWSMSISGRWNTMGARESSPE